MQHYQSAMIPPIAPPPMVVPPISQQQYVPPPLTLVWNVPGNNSGVTHHSSHPRPSSIESSGGGRGGRWNTDARNSSKSFKRGALSMSPPFNPSPSNKSSKHSHEDSPTSATKFSSSKSQLLNTATISVDDVKNAGEGKMEEDKVEEDFGEIVNGIGKGGPDGDLNSLLKLIPPKYRSAAQVGDSAAEIDKWRAARRRHFPTESVVAAKAAAQVSATARGELQILHSSGKIRHSSTATQLIPSMKKDDGDNHSQILPVDSSVPVASSTATADDDEAPDELGVSRESALRALEEEKAVANEAILQEEGGVGIRKGLGPCLRNLRGQCQRGPLCYYPHGLNGSYTPEQILNHKKPCRFFLLGKCRMDNLCPFQHTGGVSKRNSGEEARGGLLSKLLKSEIDAETSVLLQCVRYVVAEDFFKEEDKRGSLSST